MDSAIDPWLFDGVRFPTPWPSACLPLVLVVWRPLRVVVAEAVGFVFVGWCRVVRHWKVADYWLAKSTRGHWTLAFGM